MKLGHLYNTLSFKDMAEFVSETIKQVRFTDSYNGAVLERNLTSVDPKILEKKYPECTFFNIGIDSDNSGGTAKRIQSLRLLDHGEFAMAGDRTSNKGKISISGEDNDILVYDKEAFAEWTKGDIETAAVENYSLTNRLMSAMDKQYKREIDEIGFTGIGANAGLLNNSEFSTSVASGSIASLSPQDLYDEIASLITDQHNGVANTLEYMADVVVMPTDVLNHIQRTMLNTNADTSTILAALRSNFAGVNFVSSYRANDGGLSSASATVALKASEDTMKFRIPTPLEIGQIIQLGSFNWKVDARYRAAGLDILESTSGRILTGL
tara:strand:+ start:9385 stop:10356 length:972 start_codon:yes stop_codon:yes gene_type:complete